MKRYFLPFEDLGMASIDASSCYIAVTPYQTACQDLLREKPVHSGWLRKRGLRNKLKIFAWPRAYVVILHGCIYCYNSEMDNKPSCAFSLQGYVKVYRAGEITETEAPWSFKLVYMDSSHPAYLFSAPSEKEMTTWMTCVKQEILKANGKIQRTAGCDSESDQGQYEEAGSDLPPPVGPRVSRTLDTDLYEDCVDLTNDEELKGPKTQSQCRPPQVPAKPLLPRKTCKAFTPVFASPNRKTSSDGKDNPKPRSLSCPAVPCAKNIGKPVVNMDCKRVLTRGSPDGNSIKELKKESVAKDFWDSIFFNGSKEEATQIINESAEEGMYLVRVNADKSMVLHVMAKGKATKFRIWNENNKYSLGKNFQTFQRVIDLVYFHYDNPLPLVDVFLTDCAI